MRYGQYLLLAPFKLIISMPKVLLYNSAKDVFQTHLRVLYCNPLSVLRKHGWAINRGALIICRSIVYRFIGLLFRYRYRSFMLPPRQYN